MNEEEIGELIKSKIGAKILKLYEEEKQIIRLLIQDLQIEGYFDEWTEEDILKYYERRVRKENE